MQMKKSASCRSSFLRLLLYQCKHLLQCAKHKSYANDKSRNCENDKKPAVDAGLRFTVTIRSSLIDATQEFS